jgi:hypothetical protein
LRAAGGDSRQDRTQEVAAWLTTHYKKDGRSTSSIHLVSPRECEKQARLNDVGSSLTAQLEEVQQRRADQLREKVDGLPSPGLPRLGSGPTAGWVKRALDAAGDGASSVARPRSTAPYAAHPLALVDRAPEKTDAMLPRLTQKIPNMRGGRQGALLVRARSSSPVRNAAVMPRLLPDKNPSGRANTPESRSTSCEASHGHQTGCAQSDAGAALDARSGQLNDRAKPSPLGSPKIPAETLREELSSTLSACGEIL